MSTTAAPRAADQYDGPRWLSVLALLACHDEHHSGVRRPRPHRRAVALGLLVDLEYRGIARIHDGRFTLVRSGELISRLATPHAPDVLAALSSPHQVPDALHAVDGLATTVAWEWLVVHDKARNRRRPGYELTNPAATHWWRQLLSIAPRNTDFWSIAVALWFVLAEIAPREGPWCDLAWRYRNAELPGEVLPLYLAEHPHDLTPASPRPLRARGAGAHRTGRTRR